MYYEKHYFLASPDVVKIFWFVPFSSFGMRTGQTKNWERRRDNWSCEKKCSASKKKSRSSGLERDLYFMM